MLDEAAATLKANPGVTVDVNGYTDAIGSVEYDQEAVGASTVGVGREATWLKAGPVRKTAWHPRDSASRTSSRPTTRQRAEPENRRVELMPVQ